MDIANGPDGSVIFATANGLCIYNDGSWENYHSESREEHGYVDGIPLNDYVVCAESDNLGNLWLGYGNGLQIYNGYTKPVSIIYPQNTIASYSINDIQSFGKQMWIATGNSGVYCYQNGEWRWYRPFADDGVAANRIESIAADYSTGTVVLAADRYGQFVLSQNENKEKCFQKIKESRISPDMTEVRSANTGGVYFFNRTWIVHYIPGTGVTEKINLTDLSDTVNYISDISSSPDGKLVIGTNEGIFAWKNGVITDHLSRKDLINNQIKKVFVDSEGRWWFTNKLFTGYYYKNGFKSVISFDISGKEQNTNSTPEF
ncbi:ligand-binding sensor domain-containing protein [Methanomicrobium sp. W14]|uniref:hypothetical protein n=1 Tax=Methanomicrobium sp. W14 TaxID=2817839 RepID=UPI001AE7D6D3|nr:hypothetical protein [Methanomicrobium sp. W14]MBP2132989.1 ligand-binding sensor domain-containing protein [Methanomicrobium sp. W14]